MRTPIECPWRDVSRWRSTAFAVVVTAALVVPPQSVRASAVTATVPEGASPAGDHSASFETYADALEGFGFSGQLWVSQRGRVDLDRACGWADPRYHVPMTRDTRLAIGSITKNFVAAAVLKLRARGKLALSDRLAVRLPDVPADKAGITLEQLLCHMGGLATDIPDGLEVATRDKVVRAVLGQPLAELPGTQFHYSNAGFDLLAAVVERVSGQALDHFVREQLLLPAGLVASGVAGSGLLAHGPGAAGGNEWKQFGDWRDWPRGWSGTGSGRMVSTARELGQWVRALRTGRVLAPEDFALMHAKHADVTDSVHYGLGMWLRDRPSGRRLFTIGGEVPGYSSECVLDTVADRTVVVCTNQEWFGRAAPRSVIVRTLGRLSARLAGGADTLQLPPVVAPFATGSARQLEGAWVLDSGGRIEIWEQDGRLRLGARGQDAVDLFQSADPKLVARRHETARRAQGVVRAVVNADSAAMRILLPAPDDAFLQPFLRDQLRAHRATFGELSSVIGLGAIDMSWDGGTRAYARLRFPDHESDLMLGWTAGHLSDVAFDEGRPFPVLLGVAPLARGGFAAFDLAGVFTVELTLELAGDSSRHLHVKGPAGESEATPLHGSH